MRINETFSFYSADRVQRNHFVQVFLLSLTGWQIYLFIFPFPGTGSHFLSSAVPVSGNYYKILSTWIFLSPVIKD